VAPLHTALGYLNKDTTLEDCRQNRENLLADQGARFFVQFAAFFSLAKVVAEILVWISVRDALNVSFSLFRPYAVFSIIVRVVTWYAHFLLIGLAARSLQMRLEAISTESGNTLDAAQLRDNGVSALEASHTPTDELLVRWSDTYTFIWQDIGLLSERFSVRMVLAVFLFLVDATNLISSIWESRVNKFSEYQTALVLALYVPNASMILLSVAPLSFLYTMCTQDIGPKLVALAMRIEDNGQASPGTIQKCQLLANAFLLAPIELICGHFEFTPSVANTVAGVLIALLLLVLGYKFPS
jgi:hypothetical protein